MENQNRVYNGDFSGGGFLSENPEAYGLISDARPMVEDHLMVAVGGYTSEDGTYPPTLTVNSGDLLDLREGFYRDLVDETPVNENIVRLNFNSAEGRQTHPLARYCAVAAEMMTCDVLSRPRRTEDVAVVPEDCADALTEAVTDGIGKLRDVIRELTGPRPGSEKFFSVSLGACEVTCVARDEYHVELYTAGDYALYLLDRNGMRPMKTAETEMLTCDGEGRVAVNRFTIRYQGAFALLLMSGVAGEPSPADQRGILESPGLLWRHRMRLEDQFVRLLTSCADESDAVERLQRLLTGRCVGWANVSGAFMVCNGTFDDFKAQCLPRLTELEHLIALFPEGYDPETAEALTPRDTVEREYVTNALKTRPRILEKIKDTLSGLALAMLEAPERYAVDEPLGYDGVHHLTPKDVEHVYARFDSENVQDRKSLADNRMRLRDLFSEHWLKLRPLLCNTDEDAVSDARAFEHCLVLQKRVARLTAYRRQKLNALREELTKCLECLDEQGEDWVRGKGGDDSPSKWFLNVTESLPSQAHKAEEDWSRLSGYLRSLQTAYTWERHVLFLRDTAEETGIWHDKYQLILEGELLPEEWRMYARRIDEKAPHYSELLRIAETLSRRNVVLKANIQSRAAERRTANAVSDDEDWQIACLLGTLQEDGAWDKLCAGMIDQGFRNEYRAVMRRWQEEQELILRQQEAFGLYRGMYQTFVIT